MDISELKIVKVIGSGNFGQCSFVYSPKYDQYFCLKRILKDPKNPQIIKTLYNSETQLLKNISHPNVVRLYDYFENEDSYGIILEMLGGGTLKDKIEDKSLTITDIKKYFKELFAAMAHFHKLGYAHRDINTVNICFQENNCRPKFIDWGFCISAEYNQKVDSYCGTFPYVAPEIIKRKPYNPFKSDIWSLGVCLYECVVGEHPFKAKYQTEELTRAMSGNFNIPTNTSSDFIEVISSCLRVNPDERPNAEELLDLKFFQVPDNQSLSPKSHLQRFGALRSSVINSGALAYKRKGLFMVKGNIALSQARNNSTPIMIRGD